MNTTELLTATFAEHEADAPEVAETRRRIEAQIAGRPHRQRALVGVVAASTAVVAVALVPVLTDRAAGSHQNHGVPVQSVRAAPSTGAHRTSALSSSAPVEPPPATGDFPFRPGSLPPGATFDHVEVGGSQYHLEDFVFGSVASSTRGLTLWSVRGTLPDRLRDGGVLSPTTIAGSAAVAGWSPASRSYTVAIQRPDGLVMTVLAYGWDRATVTSYARQTAEQLQYGSFATPN